MSYSHYSNIVYITAIFSYIHVTVSSEQLEMLLQKVSEPKRPRRAHRSREKLEIKRAIERSMNIKVTELE